jgi:hypothetical protein
MITLVEFSWRRPGVVEAILAFGLLVTTVDLLKIALAAAA